MIRFGGSFLAGFFGTALAAIASSSPPDLALQFDSQRAWRHVQKQVEFGPRPSGSAELQKTRDYLISELRSYGLEVQEQDFEDPTPRGPVRFVNILASMPRSFSSSLFRKNPKTILIASHYDTKWLPKVRFVGANDGASSTGVLLELARVIAQNRFEPAELRVEFVFFDGEEAVQNYHVSEEDKDSADGLYGSRHYVRQAKLQSKQNNLNEFRAIILMDMVGDRDLHIQLPQGDSELVKTVFDASQSLGYRDFFHTIPISMLDDHFPFASAGVPALDLIDFEYGPSHRWWHTEEDALDKLDPKSLKITGQTVLKILEILEKQR